MRLGHLGGCTFGPDSCGMGRRRAIQKRASVSQLTQVMPKPRGRAPQGQAWDHFCGVWVPLSDDRHTQAMARASVSHLTRRMPKSYMDHAIDFGKHSKPVVLEHVRKYLETLKPGTRCTVGRAGTWNDKNDKRGGPLIERGLVRPNSGHYREAGGWDKSFTRALVYGLDTLSDKNGRRLEIAITKMVNELPNLTSVAPSPGGGGRYTQGPMRVVYLNRLKPGASIDAARALQCRAINKCPPGQMRKCEKCGAQRRQRGPCPGKHCKNERVANGKYKRK